MNILPFGNSEVMKKMSDLATSINVSSAELTVGKGITGIIKRETEPEKVQEVSFAYASPTGSIVVSALFLFDLHACAIYKD